MTHPDMASVEAAVDAVRNGEMVVVIDDDDRDNESELVMAASLATPETPEKTAFMIRHTSGIVCVPLPAEDAVRLQLGPMVDVNEAPFSTAFTVSVDARAGLTGGISAADRCHTVRTLANGAAKADDFVRPGHVFPLVAREGGVLMRSGHTESAVDLTRLAGLPPVGVSAQLLNDDGTKKGLDQARGFAGEHGLKTLFIDSLIAYRQKQESLVRRLSDFRVETRIGPGHAFIYATPFDREHHYALLFGPVGDGTDMLTRFQIEDVVADVFGTGASLDRALQRIRQQGRGVIVYLREGATGVFHQSPTGHPHEQQDTERRQQRNWREVGLGAQILLDLGISSIRLLASAQRHYVGLDGFGIHILGTESVSVPKSLSGTPAGTAPAP